MALDFKTTEEITVPRRTADQVIGQDGAVDIIRKAAKQRRNCLLIGTPGTGKSMLGQALADMLPKTKQKDVLCLPNKEDEDNPKIRTVVAGKGKNLVRRIKLTSMSGFKNKQIIFFILGALALMVPWWLRDQIGDIMAAASLLAGMMFVAAVAFSFSMLARQKKSKAPKLLVDASKNKKAPFVDATGAHAGALLGDIRHDPLQCFSPCRVEVFDGKTSKETEMAAFVENALASSSDVIREGDYKATYTDEGKITGKKAGRVTPVDVLSVNKHSCKGKMVKIVTETGKELIVTPEHKVAVRKSGKQIYVEVRKIKEGQQLICLDEGKSTCTEQVTKIKKVPYSGSLYNVTTSSGNLFANKILVKNSGGLGTPAHERVIAGAIHKANSGVLFVDEISTLGMKSQQELLSAMQENKYPITGQSARSSGAMTRTEPVPCDFILCAAGNIDTVQKMHPALRSRIRGYGYEVHMNDTLKDTPKNRKKLARFVAQEVEKDGRIQHFTRAAVEEVILEARKRASRKGYMTLVLRDLGGLVRAAGDLALEQKAKYVAPKHVRQAKKLARPLEQQMADDYIEKKKEYEVIRSEGKSIGRVNGLAVLGSGEAYSGIVLPIESEVTPCGEKADIKATGKLGELAKEAIINVSAIIMKHFGEDIKEKYDIYVQFLQTYEGVEGDSASIAVATAIMSALKEVPARQDTAITGSLSVRGEVLPVGGVTAKVEAAAEAGIKRVIIPHANKDDVILNGEQNIDVIPVKNIKEALASALVWKGKEEVLKKFE